jgi:hypothetical protein
MAAATNPRFLIDGDGSPHLPDCLRKMLLPPTIRRYRQQAEYSCSAIPDNVTLPRQRCSLARYFVVERKSGLLGEIEHSIRQTFAAPFRRLLKTGSGVGVAQCVGDMIESIEML